MKDKKKLFKDRRAKNLKETLDKVDYIVLSPGINLIDKKYLLKVENKNKNLKFGKMILNIKIHNYTSVLSNFVKNKNKNILEDLSIERSEEDLTINKLFKRLKKFLTLLKEVKE